MAESNFLRALDKEGLDHPRAPPPYPRQVPTPPHARRCGPCIGTAGARTHTGSYLGSTSKRSPCACVHSRVRTRVHIPAARTHLPMPRRVSTPRHLGLQLSRDASADWAGAGTGARGGPGEGVRPPLAVRAAPTARSNFPSRAPPFPAHRRAPPPPPPALPARAPTLNLPRARKECATTSRCLGRHRARAGSGAARPLGVSGPGL